MDDYNDAADNNLFGGGEGVLSAQSAMSFVSTVTVGNRGSARKIDFDTTNNGGHGYYSARNSVNLSAYRYVSFWIKGNSGGENLYCLVDDNSNFPKVRVGSFLTDKVTRDYQKVVISTHAFYSALINWGTSAGAFKIEANNDIASGIGSVFIDDIRFGSRPSPIWWDNFNDGAAPFTYGNDYESFASSVGVVITPSYDGTLFAGTTGFSYKITFISTTTTTNALVLIPSTGTGIDLTGTNTLVFQIAGSSNSIGGNMGIGLKDSAGVESVVSLNTYLTGGLSSSFQEVRIPISAFSGLDTTHMRYVQFWFGKLASPIITVPSTELYSINLDNIRFVDTSTPTAPSSFSNFGTALANGSVITASATLTVTADAGSTDGTLEEVRFEHDGLTGGASWYTIAIDTDVSDTSYTGTWITSATPLVQGTSYQIRALAVDVQGNYGIAGPFTVRVSSFVNPVGFTGFQVFSTSATVFIARNNNPVGTQFTLSTGSFDAASSSSGASTTLTLNLTANATYSLYVRAANGTLVSTTTTVTPSTTTLPNVPGAISFVTVAESTITLSWSANGNSLTPPTSYQVLISSNDPNFATFSASETFATQASTFSLPVNTTFYFKVRAYGISGNNSPFNTAQSAVTQAGSVPSTATAFSVTSLDTGSIVFSWTDNSNNENGFRVLSSSGTFLGSVASNATFFQLTGLSPDTLVQSSGIVAFNSAGSSTGTFSISSHTLANPVTGLSIGSVSNTRLTLSWSANSNLSTVFYDIGQSTDNFIASFSSPVAFASSLTATSSVISNLAPGGTYYFRARARNGDGVITAFSPTVSTVTPNSPVIVSTGGTITVGDTTVSSDPGVQITTSTLSDGTTQQVIVATQTANVSYGSGISLQIPGGFTATVVATSESVRMTSTGTIPITLSGFTIESESGTITVQTNIDFLTVSVSSDSPQNVLAAILSTGTKTLILTLNLPSGPVKALLGPGTLSKNVRLRFRLPASFPTAQGALRAAPGADGVGAAPALKGAPASASGTGIGVEIVLDQAIQPSRPVAITMKYRDSDVAGTPLENLAVARFEDTAQRWLLLPTSVDASTKAAIGTTDHFSKFQLMAVTAATDLNDVKAYPNPLRFHRGQTQMTFTNLTAHSTVKIYTYAGELVREMIADATGLVRWDGGNLFGERVASGVYLALIEGNGSEKVLKVAVEK